MTEERRALLQALKSAEAVKGNVYTVIPSEEFPGTFEWVLHVEGEQADREGFFDTEDEALEAAVGLFEDESA